MRVRLSIRLAHTDSTIYRMAINAVHAAHAAAVQHVGVRLDIIWEPLRTIKSTIARQAEEEIVA